MEMLKHIGQYGDIFEGNIVDFYPFDRSSYNNVCVSGYLYGHGVLKQQGKENQIGYFRENWGKIEPTTFDDLTSYFQETDSCAPGANTARRDFQKSQIEYKEEMAEARKKASKELAAHFAQIPNKIANDMARVESASRGSSAEIDRENSRKNAALQETTFNHNQSGQNSINKVSSENGIQTNEAISKPNVVTPLTLKSPSHTTSKVSPKNSLEIDETTEMQNEAVPNSSHSAIILTSKVNPINVVKPDDSFIMPDLSAPLTPPSMNEKSPPRDPSTPSRVMER